MVRVCPSPISYPTAQVQLDGAVLPLPLVAYKGQALVQPTTIRQHRAHQRGQHSDHPCHNHYQYHYEGSIPITFNYTTTRATFLLPPITTTSTSTINTAITRINYNQGSACTISRGADGTADGTCPQTCRRSVTYRYMSLHIVTHDEHRRWHGPAASTGQQQQQQQAGRQARAAFSMKKKRNCLPPSLPLPFSLYLSFSSALNNKHAPAARADYILLN